MASKMDFRRKFQNKHKKSEDENETSDSAGNSVMLFPEIMAASELMGVLREHGIELNEEEISDKSKLVELYYDNVIPMPQRKYRMNRRGREATKNQILRNKKRKLSTESSPFLLSNTSGKSEDTEKSSRFMCSYNVPSSGGDRLKPPPIKAERKIISLKSSTSSGSKSGVDHLKINTVPTNSSKESTIKRMPCSTSADSTNSKGENSGENSKSLTKVIQTSPEVNVKRKIIRLNRTSLGLESKEEDSVSPDPDKNGSQPQTFPVKETEDLPDGTKKVSTSDPTGEVDEVVSKKFKKVAITWP